jgi:hypothetical protein
LIKSTARELLLQVPLAQYLSNPTVSASSISGMSFHALYTLEESQLAKIIFVPDHLEQFTVSS